MKVLFPLFIFFVFPILQAFSQGEVIRSSTKEAKGQFSTPTLELTYQNNPAELGHGMGFHLNFPRNHKRGDIAHFGYGFGSGYYQRLYYIRNIKIGQAHRTLDRVHVQLTGSFKLMNPQGGFLIRLGYNLDHGDEVIRDFGRFGQIGLTTYHRIHNEFLLYKSFGEKATGIGVLGSVQVLVEPVNISDSIVYLTIGMGF